MAKAPRARWLLTSVLPRVGRGLVAAVVLSIPVFVLALLVRGNWSTLLDADQRIAVSATNFTREHGLRSALVAWQELTHPKMVYLYAVPIAILTWVKGFRARTIWGVVTMLVGWNLGLQAKLIVERARPLIDEPIEHAPGYSFPSGHAFNITMMVVTCLIMTWPLLRRTSGAVRSSVIALGAVAIVLTMLDRVFLGVHFASDVTAGLLFAVSLSVASYLGFSHTPRRSR